MRRLPLNRSEPAKKSGQNIPKNRCRTTIAERMGETPAELPFIGDQVVCLSHNQAARSGPTKEARARGSARDQLKPPHPGGATTVGPSGSRRDFGGTSGRCQSVRRRNQPMPSAIKKVSIGVSATPATTNQNCVSERLRIGMMSHAEDALTRPRREKWSGAVIYYTQRPGSVVFSVTNTSDCSFFNGCLILI